MDATHFDAFTPVRSLMVATKGRAPRRPILASGLMLVMALLLSASSGLGMGRSGTAPQGSLSLFQDATPLAVAPAAPCVGGENLLENAGFEAGTDGWYVNEFVAPVTTETHEGTMAVRLGTRDDVAYMDNSLSPLEPGATYSLSAWGKLSTSGETAEIGVQFYDGDGERLVDEEPVPLTFSGTEFEQRQLTFSLPAQVVTITVYLTKVAGAADFSADSLSLTSCQVEEPAAATPGATPGPEMLATPTAEAVNVTPTEEPEVATPTEEPAAATPSMSEASEARSTPAEPGTDRSGCDPAYPEDRTCIPPGPPFDQGCAITMERNFVVLPPDPQHLDRDRDGIGCEPIKRKHR